MDNSKKWLIGFASLLLLVTGVGAKEIDESSGLIIDDNFELVKTNCTVCHSTRNIIQQSGTRLTWFGLIRWMQKTQGLWEFEPETENQILDYLETNYGPKEVSYRRPPISPFLMPPNPYITVATIGFVGLPDVSEPDNIFNVDLALEDFPEYSKGRFDLWVAMHFPNLPESEFIFVTGTAWAPIFGIEAQPFLSSLKPVDGTYQILKDFTVPVVDEGRYIFYALLVEQGVNPLQDFERNRSNLAIQGTALHH